ncbi:hypothetical protein MRX96_008963 [Rhipicephalus microplus]
MIRYSSSTKCNEEFPVSDPGRSDHSPFYAGRGLCIGAGPGNTTTRSSSGEAASFFSLSENVEALTPMRPDTTEPYQTMCTIVNNTKYSLPLHKASLSEDANKMSPNQT